MRPSLARKAQLTERELSMLAIEMSGRGKNLLVAYALWFGLGTLGAYHFYLGDRSRGWKYVAATIIGFVTLIVLVGLVILLVMFVLYIVDAVKMPGRVADANAVIESELIDELLAGRSEAPVDEPAA